MNKHIYKYFEPLFYASTALFANFGLVKACMKGARAGYRNGIFLLLPGFLPSFRLLYQS